MEKTVVELFPAFGGDCILVTFEAIDYRILIDGGFRKTFSDSLAPRLQGLGAAGKAIDLLVVTHVDNDHIMGIIELFRSLRCKKTEIEIREIWYNGYRHLFSDKRQHMSVAQERRIADEVRKIDVPVAKACMGKEIGYAQGETLAGLLEGIWEDAWNKNFAGKAVCCCGDAGRQVELYPDRLRAAVLNPGLQELHALEYEWNQFRRKKWLPMGNGGSIVCEECFERFLAYVDPSVTNQSSIAFLLTYLDGAGKEYQLLFLGDASAERCLDRLEGWKDIQFDCLKLPHHGSKNNITEKTLGLLQAGTLLFSTDGRQYGHPDAEVVEAAVRSEKCRRMLFNYAGCKAVDYIKEKYPQKEIMTGEEGYCRINLDRI